jgi:hypothetical protein
MMNAFSALLEARDPALGRFRSYRLQAGQDLFGAWLVEVTYGRIGAPGRRLHYIAGDEAEARKLVHYCLRRRATAKKRIGVSYCFRELVDPWEWFPLTIQ